MFNFKRRFNKEKEDKFSEKEYKLKDLTRTRNEPDKLQAKKQKIHDPDLIIP